MLFFKFHRNRQASGSVQPGTQSQQMNLSLLPLDSFKAVTI